MIPGEVPIRLAAGEFRQTAEMLKSLENQIHAINNKKIQGIAITQKEEEALKRLCDQYNQVNRTFEAQKRQYADLTRQYQQAQEPTYYGVPEGYGDMGAGMPPMPPGGEMQGEPGTPGAPGPPRGAGGGRQRMSLWRRLQTGRGLGYGGYLVRRWAAPIYLGYKAYGFVREGMELAEQMEFIQNRIQATADSSAQFRSMASHLRAFRMESEQAVAPLQRLQYSIELMAQARMGFGGVEMRTPDLELIARRLGLRAEQFGELYKPMGGLMAAGYRPGRGQMRELAGILLSTPENKAAFQEVLGTFTGMVGQLRSQTWMRQPSQEFMETLAGQYGGIMRMFPGDPGMASQALMRVHGALSAPDDRVRAMYYRALQGSEKWGGAGFFEWQKTMQRGITDPDFLKLIMGRARMEAGGDRDVMGMVLTRMLKGDALLAEKLLEMTKAGTLTPTKKELEEMKKGFDERDPVLKAIRESYTAQTDELKKIWDGIKSDTGESLNQLKLLVGYSFGKIVAKLAGREGAWGVVENIGEKYDEIINKPTRGFKKFLSSLLPEGLGKIIREAPLTMGGFRSFMAEEDIKSLPPELIDAMMNYYAMATGGGVGPYRGVQQIIIHGKAEDETFEIDKQTTEELSGA